MLEFEIQHTLLSNIRQPLLELVQRPETFVDALLLVGSFGESYSIQSREGGVGERVHVLQQSVEKRRHPVFVCLHPGNVPAPGRWIFQEFR